MKTFNPQHRFWEPLNGKILAVGYTITRYRNAHTLRGWVWVLVAVIGLALCAAVWFGIPDPWVPTP